MNSLTKGIGDDGRSSNKVLKETTQRRILFDLPKVANRASCAGIVLLKLILILTCTISKCQAFQLHHYTMNTYKYPQRQSPSMLSYSNNPYSYSKKYNKRNDKSKKDIQKILRQQYSDLRNFHQRERNQKNAHDYDHHDANAHRQISQSTSTSASFDKSDFSSMEANIFNSIWKCRDVREVHQILSQFIDAAKDIIHQASSKNTDGIIENDDSINIQLVGPNIAATALRRIIDIRPDFNGRNAHKNQEDIKIAKALIPSLLQVVGREVVHAESEQTITTVNESDLYTFHNLLVSVRNIAGGTEKSMDWKPVFTAGMTPVSNANMLYSLSKIKVLQKKNGKYNDDTTLKPLAQKICANIRERDAGDEDACRFVKIVNPLLLIEVLRALATFGLKNEDHLLLQIGDRLKQGDATGKLNSGHLSFGLWAYAVLERPHLGLLKSFSRRLRKANLRQDMTATVISRSMWAAGQSMKQLDLIVQDTMESELDSDGKTFVDEDIALLREDLVTMIHTLSGELMRLESDGVGLETKIEHLQTRQITDLLSTFVIFEFDPGHAIIGHLHERIQSGLVSAKQEYTPHSVSRILWSFQRLKAPMSHQTVQVLLQNTLDTVTTVKVQTCSPKILNTIVRSAVMMLPDNGSTMPKIHQLLSYMLKQENFLLRCNEFECSNYIWCLAMTKSYDKDLIRLISERMQNEDIISSLTPSSASRFLWSFCSLVENNAQDFEMKEILFENFQTFGGILLSSEVTPVDSSSAMWAMAKSSYSLDMGIFDHLAEVLATDFMLERASIQQITRALWSCGKMISWEDPLSEKMEFGEVTAPPYVQSGERFASYLATCNELMSAKDVSQTLWAIGRLKIADQEIVNPLAKQATLIAMKEEFNSQELANIIWALSKVDFDNVETISKLTNQIQRPSLLENASPQEAANILYALGKMGIRDEAVFSSMNSVLMRQLDNATSQTIANALWAHDNVDLQPPRQLFDTWAKEKLDIVGLYLDNQQVEIIQQTKESKSGME